MGIEAANQTLGEIFNDAKSECEAICRKVLQRHRLTESDNTDARLLQFFCKVTGNECYESIDFNNEPIVTETIEQARLQHEGWEIFHRHIEKYIYLDSISYKRSKFGNCCVNFQKNGKDFFRKIQFFIGIPGVLFFNELLASFQIYRSLEDVGLVKGVYYRVQETLEEKLIPMDCITKVFCLNKFLGTEK